MPRRTAFEDLDRARTMIMVDGINHFLSTHTDADLTEPNNLSRNLFW